MCALRPCARAGRKLIRLDGGNHCRLCSDSSERLRVQLERPLAFDCMSSVPSPHCVPRRLFDDARRQGVRRTQHGHRTPAQRPPVVLVQCTNRSTIRIRSAARSTCVICYFTRHVQQLYCYKLLTFTFVAAGSMAASRTACELHLSCTLAHPSRFLVVLVLGPGLLASPLRPRVSTWIMSSWLSLKSMMC